jgi:hypothetical protein
MIKVAYAMLHHPLFLGGKNHGEKLFNKSGMEISYDRVEKELIVTYNGKTQYIPSTNVAAYEPWTDPKEEKRPAALRGPIKAQVTTPQDHVFSSGPGKTHN